MLEDAALRGEGGEGVGGGEGRGRGSSGGGDAGSGELGEEPELGRHIGRRRRASIANHHGSSIR
jgi:hypothetical protein